MTPAGVVHARTITALGGVFCLALIALAIRDAEIGFAWTGWSVIDWVNHVTLPGLFQRDFPSGSANYDTSAFLHLYRLAAEWFALPPEVLLPWMIAAEVLAQAGAMLAIARALGLTAAPAVGWLCAALVLASPATSLDFTRFGMPQLHGLFYCAAEALRLFAIAAALYGRFWLAAGLLGAAAVTHPLMAMAGAIFLLAAFLAPRQRIASRQGLIAGGIFLVIAVPWFVMQMQGKAITAASIPTQTWYEYVRLFSVHFFPIELGVFSNRVEEQFLGLLAYSLLLLHYFQRSSIDATLKRRLAYGIITLYVIAIASVAIPQVTLAPLFIKLALPRVIQVAILVSLPIVVAGLWNDLTGANWWMRGAAALVLFSPFLWAPGWPLLPVALLLTPTRRRSITAHASRCDSVVAVGAIAVLGVFATYLIAGEFDWRAPVLWGSRSTWYCAAGFLTLTGLWRWRSGSDLSLAAIGLLAVLGLGVSWAVRDAPSGEKRALQYDYLNTQLWARRHTAPAALFMPEPSHYYGWRDYSRRSSFGNLREWLHTSWLYDSNAANFRDGTQRFAEFGVDIDPYFRVRPSNRGARALAAEVSRRYNTADDTWRINLARKYGIDYFVIHRRLWKASTQLPVMYQSEHFMILAAHPDSAVAAASDTVPR